MKTALVTGIAGQDGSYLAELLIGHGLEVHGLIRPGRVIPPEHRISGVNYHEVDLKDHEGTRRAIFAVKPDMVFSLAGMSSVARSWEDPADTIAINSTAVAALIEAAWQLSVDAGRAVRFVQASSAEIFGSTKEVPQNEETGLNPISPYGASKALAHYLVGVYRKRGMHASSAILYNHESVRRPPTFVTRKITSTVARIALGSREILNLGNIEAIRDWGWAPDFADAMYRMALQEAPDDFVIATGEAHTVREFVDQAFAAAGIEDWERHVRVDAKYFRPTDAAEMIGDSGKARRQLGWEPTVHFEEIVSLMVANDLCEQRALTDNMPDDNEERTCLA